MAKKELKHVVKRKTRRDNLRALVQAPPIGFAALLLSCAGSPTLLLFCSHMPASLSFRPRGPTLLSFAVPASFSLLLSTLLFCSILRQALIHLTSSVLQTFKQTPSDEPLRHHSTIPTGPFC